MENRRQELIKILNEMVFAPKNETIREIRAEKITYRGNRRALLKELRSIDRTLKIKSVLNYE